MKEMKTNNKGFSLVELIVVVAIMAVLMVVLAPAMLRYVEKTRIQKDDSAASEVRTALENALADNAIYEKVNGSATIEVKITGTDGVVTITGDSADNAIKEDIWQTIGGEDSTKTPKIKIASKDRAGKTCKFTATYSSTRQAYIISDIAWS